MANIEPSGLAQYNENKTTVPETGLLEYHLVKSGILTASQVVNLVER